MDGESWGVSLSQFKQLGPQEQVLLLVPAGTLDSECAAASAQRIAKLMSATLEPLQRQHLLTSLISQDAARHLPWVVHIFERLRLHRQVRLPLRSALHELPHCILEPQTRIIATILQNIKCN